MKQTILVADDSEVERARALSALNSAGYRVVEALDGQQALELFAREKPDLVMLDVVMPRLTGLETCRILKARAQGAYLPVIMLSSRNSVNARVEGLRSGADDYLGKPFDTEELVARVEALLRTGQAIRDSSAEASRTSLILADGPGGREGFEARIDEEFQRAERYSDPLACLRVEFDPYSSLVDAGKPELASEGVDALRQVIEGCIRKIDLVFRTDERGYILVLPNTHFPGALAVAERICIDARRIQLGNTNTPDEQRPPITVSVGVSFFPNKDTHSVEDLVNLVGAALDRARSEGGGRICLYQHQGYLYAPEG